MAYGMVFIILSATYHVLKVLHVLCMYRSDYLDSLQKVFRYRSNDEGASLRLGMAYCMLFNIFSAVYHVLNVLHALRMYRSDKMLLSECLQKVFRYSSNDEGASLRWGMAYGMLFNIFSAVYHVLNVLHAVRMYRSD